ncbi:MAG: glycosyltransferase, partial [Planctomycetes bacterium]|nr:glycosyltransferase [Planctomycetota bacterium]
MARRILMINTERGWRGGENQVWLLARRLTAGFEAITACQAGETLDERLRAVGSRTCALCARSGFDLGAIRMLRRLMRDERIDLVHAHASHAHSLAVWACLGSDVPLVVTRRVDFGIGGNPLRRWKYQRATRIAAVSGGVQRVLADGGIPAERIEVIHDGVDLAFIRGGDPSTLRTRLGIPASAVVFGITAHLTDHKDHRTLLHAFARVEAAVPDAWLLIAGTGELADELQALAGELRLARCRFLGFVPDVRDVLGALDVFVLSSHMEGLGSSVMDAMARGIPVVATRAGGLPELVDHDRDGVLVPVRDPTALSAAMIRLAHDRDLR